MINKSDLKVGVFVLMGLTLGALVVFLIGGERRVFETAVDFKTAFDDVGGLKPGAPVNMGGVRIGKVESVEYSEEANDTRVHVILEVVKDEAVRIRGGWHDVKGKQVWKGTKALVTPKGLLGDMQVELTKGEGEQLAPGAEIPGEPREDMMGSIGGVVGKAEDAIANVSVVAEKLADERLHKDIRESAHGLNVVLKQLSEGEGYPHRLLTDPEEAERISRAIDNIDHVATELNQTLREVRLTAERVRTGPGFAHDVIYGDGPKKEIEQFGMAAEEVAVTLKGIREGDGIAHDMLFGGESNPDEAVKNITQVTADLRDIVRNVKQGKGTIGAFLVDPSIYEDVKRLLGNVERNSVLRALVRYSIKKDGKRTEVEDGHDNDK
jgi:phospholipid/cholesterol/gamma-HCH transport system substrate-binding protein